MGRNYLMEGLKNPFGLNSTRRENTPQDVMKFVGGQLANPFGLNDSDRWDNGLGGGPRNTSPVAPTAPTQKPIQPRTERKPGPFDAGYVKPNTTMEPTEEATLSQYLNPGPRQDTRTNGNGLVQAGMKMSGGVSAAFVPEYANSSFNDLLTTVNNGQFSSNSLPGSSSDPFAGTAPKTQSFNTEAESYTSNSLADFGGDGSAAFAQSRERTGNDTFNPDAARIEGGSSRKKGGSLAEALADKEGINSYMSKFSDGDRQRAANRAFLDTEDSMDALRAKEAVNGVVYANQKHYISGASGDDAAIAIDRSQARDISNGRSTAQGLLDAHIAKNKKVAAESTPAEQQAPALLESGARDGAFQQDKSMFSGSKPAIESDVEFDLNNSEALGTIEAPKGYKPQSTYKDPSFPNPFNR
tara:strand:+ start:311 stop:1546 length:1236 start_codon:yes stop_codon:yes gene_type:complete